MKLWLDDVRPAPPGWIPIRNAEDFKRVVLGYDWEMISFDHDLGIESTLGFETKEITGYDLAVWMFDSGRLPARKPKCHSANPDGRRRIEALIEERWKG